MASAASDLSRPIRSWSSRSNCSTSSARTTQRAPTGNKLPAPHIAARSLGLIRGERLLFKDIDIALGQGDALRLSGANGTGKSSLLRVLAGLLRPTVGDVERDGTLAYLGHTNGLSRRRTLRQELAFRSAPLDPAERLGLAPLLDIPLYRLSQGQQRRAGLAAALAMRSQIWLLDEPAAGLDSGNRETLSALITNQLMSGGTVIVASHGETDLPPMPELRLEAPE